MDAYQKMKKKYIDFYTAKKHVEIPISPLILENDATTLFTSAGMQPIINNLLGEPSQYGKRLVNIQPCFRALDIEEIGDNRHTTFFEMLGNWSLGDYYKEEQLVWCFEFFTDVIGLQKDRLFVSVFEGSNDIPRDDVSEKIWTKLGIRKSNMFFYGVDKNWWSRAGEPKNMPIGEIGGTSSEVFYDFGIKHDKKYGSECHPNCDCGRFFEIGNTVFIQYKKSQNNELVVLPQQNVDFGGGLERILAAAEHDNDIFKTVVFQKIIKAIEKETNKEYGDVQHVRSMRMIADHMKGAVFMIAEGTLPSNKVQGYVLRRLIRRSILKMKALTGSIESNFDAIVESIFHTYEGSFVFDKILAKDTIKKEIRNETVRFSKTIEQGLKIIEKTSTIDGKTAFNLYQSYGFPYELTKEIILEKGGVINDDDFQLALTQHKTLSKSASIGMFKGGLADHSDAVIKYHTATHLLHQALHDVLGDGVRQEGSNITGERLRFDYNASRALSQSELAFLTKIINDKIKDKLSVHHVTMPKSEAIKLGARSFFKEKYGDIVSVYYIGKENAKPGGAYSLELCGGPHVTNTAKIGTITIDKYKKIGTSIYRIYAH